MMGTTLGGKRFEEMPLLNDDYISTEDELSPLDDDYIQEEYAEDE